MWFILQALDLCHKFFSSKISFTPTFIIGSGIDGDVYDIKYHPDKVIKYCIQYEVSNLDMQCKNINTILDYLKLNSIICYAKLYDYNILIHYGVKKYILYYYVMEKLLKISEDEEKVFHSILSHEDRKIEKNFSQEKINKILSGLSRGLDFHTEKVMLFCSNLRYSPIRHLDVHPRNIMKDNVGNYKLVDFDRMKLEIENG